MTTSAFRVVVQDSFKLSTRPHGAAARSYLLEKLTEHDVVVIDFEGVDPSPSFADECVGMLCKILGVETFKRRVRLVNLSDTARTIVRHVVATRVLASQAPAFNDVRHAATA
ncbi:STAS-like domain-containing protein [Chitinasiproducens palmae]|uniref:STAS-like domain-containing protein n=1 Tax=Chitinasiproducens palmae TaxID=1770053 RepID=UPI00147A75F2|nr:STAS-like domain-containing protein [Chitinasiproducens palmae]